LLKSVIATFPFVSIADRAVALSGILTTSIRRAIDTAPLHGFTAPAAGSGKSMLVDIASVISSGRQAAVVAQGKTEEELEKRIGASLMAGDVLVSIDNCEEPLGGELLCQAITQSVLKIRILGKSINVDVPSNAALFATGNNLTVIGDMTRRTLLCALNPNCERPETREFPVNPIEMIQAARARYVTAALVVLRAYHVAGRPRMVAPLGSFVGWSSWIRSALMWLGEPDPCATMEKARKTDPKLAALTAVLQNWEVVLSDRRVLAKEAIGAAVMMDDDGQGSLTFVNASFRDALYAVAGENGVISGKRLGTWLSKNQGRVVAGLKIVEDGSAGGTAIWRVESAEQTAPASAAFSGSSGFSGLTEAPL
jgi:putative DNA primase/helicase